MQPTHVNEDDANLRCHLEMIQRVITRLANNCVALKALASTITVAILFYSARMHMGETSSFWVPLTGAMAALIFWWMDAKYLYSERQFRALYDAVRRGEMDAFSMDITKHGKHVASTYSISLSWSVCFPYLANVIILLVVALNSIH